MNSIKTRKQVRFTIIMVLILMIFSLSVISGKTDKTVLTNSETNSNKKIGWGIKRNDNHEQPDVGSLNKKILEENQGICLGNNEKKNIYLTFDEGYEAGYTPQILSTLKENNVTAAFFITAHYVNTQPELVKQMIDEGNIIGNHTVNHKSMPDLEDEKVKSEVMDLHTVIYEKFGYEMKYMRPPKGEFSERTLSITDSLGFKTVMWSFAYVDWNDDKQPSKEEAMKKIISNLHNGEIMLLHATSKTNSEIMGEMVDKIKEEGYEIKSLEEFR